MGVEAAVALGSQHWKKLALAKAGEEAGVQVCQRLRRGAARGTLAVEGQAAVAAAAGSLSAWARAVLGCLRKRGWRLLSLCGELAGERVRDRVSM